LDDILRYLSVGMHHAPRTNSSFPFRRDITNIGQTSTIPPKGVVDRIPCTTVGQHANLLATIGKGRPE
jgi:hypothetical protein